MRTGLHWAGITHHAYQFYPLAGFWYLLNHVLSISLSCFTRNHCYILLHLTLLEQTCVCTRGGQRSKKYRHTSADHVYSIFESGAVVNLCYTLLRQDLAVCADRQRPVAAKCETKCGQGFANDIIHCSRVPTGSQPLLHIVTSNRSRRGRIRALIPVPRRVRCNSV